MQAIEASRVRSGSHGSCWLDGELAAEVYGFQAKITKTKEAVPRCGAFIEGNKLMSAKITGTVKLYNATSRLIESQANNLKNGKDTRCTIISKLDDPDATSAQRVQFTGVSFDDVTLADWEAAKIGTIEAPFTADGFEVLET
jgi:hypothetical protein